MWYKQRIVLPEEKIYEIVTSEDNIDFGLVVVDVVRSDPHYHRTIKETYTLIEGQLWVHVDGEVFLLDKFGETIEIPIGLIHWAESVDPKNPAKISVLTKPAWNPRDHILVDWPY